MSSKLLTYRVKA